MNKGEAGSKVWNFERTYFLSGPTQETQKFQINFLYIVFQPMLHNLNPSECNSFILINFCKPNNSNVMRYEQMF